VWFTISVVPERASRVARTPRAGRPVADDLSVGRIAPMMLPFQQIVTQTIDEYNCFGKGDELDVQILWK
jgi:hypothetical protein